MSNQHNTSVGALRPRRNQFDLSYRKNFTCDMGQLIPVVCDEAVPGDYFKIGNEVVIRFQPLAAPIMHEIYATVHYFFVPYRILWDQWEDYISQGLLSDGTPAIPIPTYQFPSVDQPTDLIGTLWDFFGFPIPGDVSGPVRGQMPIDFPWRAYNLVYNEYYRDQDLQEEVDFSNHHVLNRNWAKDYFTVSRPFRQKGVPPALPVNIDISGPLSADWNYVDPNLPFLSGDRFLYLDPNQPGVNRWTGFGSGTFSRDNIPAVGGGNYFRALAQDPGTLFPSSVQHNFKVDPNGVGLDLVRGLSVRSPTATATTFDVSDLRLAFQTQKWLERNARAGTRYTEFLQSHFSVSPSDSRLQRPEYIGGTKQPVVISEVLQTSATSSTAQGNMSGHGLSADGQFAGDYNVQEYGLIIGLLSVMPKPSYQNGINRQWLRRLPTDFYFPEFAHLSEQAIYQAEIAWDRGITTDGIFGYIGQYDEMRTKHDMVCSEMRYLQLPTGNRDQLSYWNLTRVLPQNTRLNSEFITCVPRKDVFLVNDVPGLIVNVENLIHAVRPMPEIAEPGYIDHY